MLKISIYKGPPILFAHPCKNLTKPPFIPFLLQNHVRYYHRQYFLGTGSYFDTEVGILGPKIHEFKDPMKQVKGKLKLR